MAERVEVRAQDVAAEVLFSFIIYLSFCVSFRESQLLYPTWPNGFQWVIKYLSTHSFILGLGFSSYNIW